MKNYFLVGFIILAGLFLFLWINSEQKRKDSESNFRSEMNALVLEKDQLNSLKDSLIKQRDQFKMRNEETDSLVIAKLKSLSAIKPKFENEKNRIHHLPIDSLVSY